MKLPFDITLQYIIDEYNLTDNSHNVKVYINIEKIVYGLPQDVRIAYDRLNKNLDKHRYQPVKYTLGIWTQKYIPIYLRLIVNEFLIKYVRNKHADHLIQALQ